MSIEKIIQETVDKAVNLSMARKAEYDKLRASHDRLMNAISRAINNMESPSVLAQCESQSELFFGLEDRGITDRHNACVYGHDYTIGKVREWIIDDLEIALAEAKQI